MPKKTTWTKEKYERLAELYPGKTNKEIVAITGWALKDIAYRAGIIGVKKNKETERRALARIEFTADHEAFIREHYNEYSNKQLAQALGMSLGYIRTRCYEMGLLRMNIQYWTDEQIAYLVANYQTIGDKEMAAIFTQRWHKEKGWTLKHIEKKRNYLGLHRTKSEIDAIRDRNVDKGVFNPGPEKRWLDRGITKEGDVCMGKIRDGRYVPYIKVKGHFRLWSRWAWEQVYGNVPGGHMVVFKTDPSEWVKGVEVLEMITREEGAIRMAKNAAQELSDNMVAYLLTTHQPELRNQVKQMPELLEMKRQDIFLKRAIKEKATEQKSAG
jgi:hypothetical protein